LTAVKRVAHVGRFDLVTVIVVGVEQFGAHPDGETHDADED
jgi:hypothetical protein